MCRVQKVLGHSLFFSFFLFIVLALPFLQYAPFLDSLFSFSKSPRFLAHYAWIAFSLLHLHLGFVNSCLFERFHIRTVTNFIGKRIHAILVQLAFFSVSSFSMFPKFFISRFLVFSIFLLLDRVQKYCPLQWP